VPGVALSEVRGGREREVRITFDPYRAAELGVELPEAAALAGGADDMSAGFADVGKRRYTVRFTGAYTVEDLGELVIDWREGNPILLRDVADVAIQMQDRQSFVIQNGQLSMATNAHRETGVNVLEVMAGLRKAVTELREGPLKRARLSIEQVYDETIYIDRSIAMVRNNLLLGVALAIVVLWWFLRHMRSTLMVALAIPLSVISSFIILNATGRTVNVISLAGLAFAVGMVLDAAIVVLENIVRLREGGEESDKAADKGTTQVWGALLASTATTVAIFLPIVFLEDEAGQLFADLALTIAAAIIFSLIVAITVLPTAASQWLKHSKLDDPHQHWWDAASKGIMALTATTGRRLLWIFGLSGIAVAVVLMLMPKPDYLPEGNRNLVFAFILPPPGNNIETMEKEMGRVIAERMQPYVDGEQSPMVSDYFFVAFGRGVFMGARTEDPTETGMLVPLINQVIGGFPDTIAFAKRSSLFGGFGEGKTINVDIQGRNVESLLQAAQVGFGAIRNVIPGSSVRPFPGLDLSEPELRLVPKEREIAEAGWNRETMGGIVRALGDGLFVGDYFDGQERLDIILRALPWDTPEDLAAIPLATPDAGVQPLDHLIRLQRTAGPDELRRIDRRRTITLQVTVPENLSMGEALEIIKAEVEPVIANYLPEDGEIRYTGSASKLDTALENMLGTFLLAIVILYLLISALFRSFVDSLLVLMTIPLAAVGGVVALWLMGAPADLLTMIGFVILLGLVVNNAILLVHQTRAAEREGMSRRDAVGQAVRLRLRPILMSTLTSIFGMLPLLLLKGAGTELYQGLAAVIVGGMSVSTVFTLLLLPSLLRMGEDRHQAATA
jgi:multidrug efflux pump subunit AcrB